MPVDDDTDYEALFLKSWNVENAFKSYLEIDNIVVDAQKYARYAVVFIEEIRRYGYDKKFRAGTQLGTLILSRSKKYGLRVGQPHIRVGFEENELTLVWWDYVDGELNTTSYTFDSLKITYEVRAILDQLAALPID